MKFRIVKEHTYDWPVQVRMPDPDKAGAVLTMAFKGRFRLLPLDEARDIAGRIGTATNMGEAADFEVETIHRVLVGWDDDVAGEDGKPVAFSSEALDQALQIGPFRTAVLDAYGKSVKDGGAKRGN